MIVKDGTANKVYNDQKIKIKIKKCLLNWNKIGCLGIAYPTGACAISPIHDRHGCQRLALHEGVASDFFPHFYHFFGLDGFLQKIALSLQ